MMLVTLEQGKQRLRVDTNDEDADLTDMIKGASRAVLLYLKAEGIADFADSSGNLVEDSEGIVEGVPDEVQTATLLMLGYLYRQRDNDDNHEFETGYLPRPVTAILYGRRDPALA
jgi:hypothetical protein